MNSSGGGGAARPPPSASMGKLSLEDEAARKGNANGPSGKNLNLNQFEGWKMEYRINAILQIYRTSIVQTVYPLTGETDLPLFVPHLSSLLHPLWRGQDR